jgi:hypothetical protein
MDTFGAGEQGSMLWTISLNQTGVICFRQKMLCLWHTAEIFMSSICRLTSEKDPHLIKEWSNISHLIVSDLILEL